MTTEQDPAYTLDDNRARSVLEEITELATGKIQGGLTQMAFQIGSTPAGMWIDTIAGGGFQYQSRNACIGPTEYRLSARGFRKGGSLALQGADAVLPNALSQRLHQKTIYESCPVLADMAQAGTLDIWQPAFRSFAVDAYGSLPSHHDQLTIWASGANMPLIERLYFKLGYSSIMDIAKRVVRDDASATFDSLLLEIGAGESAIPAVNNLFAMAEPHDLHRR